MTKRIDPTFGTYEKRTFEGKEQAVAQVEGPSWTGPTTSTVVDQKPKCQYCEHKADYDAKTRYGPWAYMCSYHYVRLGVGLGLGKGQMLLERGTEEEE